EGINCNTEDNLKSFQNHLTKFILPAKMHHAGSLIEPKEHYGEIYHHNPIITQRKLQSYAARGSPRHARTLRSHTCRIASLSRAAREWQPASWRDHEEHRHPPQDCLRRHRASHRERSHLLHPDEQHEGLPSHAS